jgi:hypothetical protein
MVKLAGYQKISRQTVIHEWVFRDKERLYTWMLKFCGFSVPKKNLITQIDASWGSTSKKLV